MPENNLVNLFNSVQNDYFNRKYKKIVVEFQNFRSLKHTVQWTPWRIRIQVNDHFRDAPDEILEKLAIILLAKVYRVKVGKEIRRPYNDYVESLRKTLPANKYNRLDAYKADGKYYNLANIFQKLNDLYFGNKLNEPILGWSRKKSYWRLGFYDRERNLLVISRIFDNSQVPNEIVDYLVYHEMLHIYFPTERKNGRRLIHPPEFKETERRYPKYQSIQNWLKTNVRKL